MDIFDSFIAHYGIHAGFIVLVVGGLFYAFVQKGVGFLIALAGGVILLLHHLR